MTTQDIEITLPEDSIFRKLVGENAVETNLTDDDYNKLLSDFLNKARISATPQAKIKEHIEKQADQRKPLRFRKGFLTVKANHTSSG